MTTYKVVYPQCLILREMDGLISGSINGVPDLKFFMFNLLFKPLACSRRLHPPFQNIGQELFYHICCNIFSPSVGEQIATLRILHHKPGFRPFLEPQGSDLIGILTRVCDREVQHVRVLLCELSDPSAVILLFLVRSSEKMYVTLVCLCFIFPMELVMLQPNALCSRLAHAFIQTYRTVSLFVPPSYFRDEWLSAKPHKVFKSFDTPQLVERVFFFVEIVATPDCRLVLGRLGMYAKRVTISVSVGKRFVVVVSTLVICKKSADEDDVVPS